MRILFLCDPEPNYVPDLLLHGLRKLLGPDVVDVPRKHALYEGMLGQRHLSPIPGLMPDDRDVDREDIAARLPSGYFDLLLCDVRALSAFMPWLRQGVGRFAVIDGEDRPAAIAPGPYVILRRETDGRDFSAPLPMSLPIELLAAIAHHDDVPKTHSIGFLGSRSRHTLHRNAMLDALASRFPDALIGAWETSEAGWTGRDAYYRAMQSCRAVLSLPGAGFDTFRYWENAACNALHLAPRMPLFIPDDFRVGVEALRFDTLGQLADLVERVVDGVHDWRGFGERSREWLRAYHTTERRAVQVIDLLRRAYGMAA